MRSDAASGHLSNVSGVLGFRQNICLAVHRDFYVEVAKSFYEAPTEYIERQ